MKMLYDTIKRRFVWGKRRNPPPQKTDEGELPNPIYVKISLIDHLLIDALLK